MNGVVWLNGKPILISDFYKVLELERKDANEKSKEEVIEPP